VESALDYLNLGSDAILLDPWNGSGTTSLVTNRRNMHSLGFDINPAMNTFLWQRLVLSLLMRKFTAEKTSVLAVTRCIKYLFRAVASE